MKRFFKAFDIEEKRGHRILAELLVDIQAECMCQSCGIHPLEEPALKLLLKNERQYQEKEHMFLFYTLGHLMMDYSFWEQLYKYVPFDLGKEFSIQRIQDLLDSLYKEQLAHLQ